MALHECMDPAVSDFLGLFEGPLHGVPFPDVSGKALSELASQVQACAQAVGRARAELEAAQVALEERKQALLAKVQRGMAYARIFAEENEELRVELDRIHLPRSGLKTDKKESPAKAESPGRGRPRLRKAQQSNPLFGESGDAAAAE